MAPLARWWALVSDCLNSLSSSYLNDYQNQHPVGNVVSHGVSKIVPEYLDTPLFRPPGSNLPNFTCEYPQMKGWRECHLKDQGCWLEQVGGPGKFNILTDYENNGPIGIDRHYTLVIEDGWINADGINFTEAKLINNSFPGPLLEACWGDRVHIKVVNKLKLNGTSVHWHGIRQLNNTNNDGVNGVTQCPLPPGSEFTYSWNVTQYGSSWLHSHYSVQYADGVQAPITLHGPSSMNYTDSVKPLIMSDWGHNSAFQALYSIGIPIPGLTLDGLGNTVRYNPYYQNTTIIPPTYAMNFSTSLVNGAPRKYLVRVINSAYDTGLRFSIDQHDLWIVEADFVPVKPYKVQSILVAIGQRYMMVVEAKPRHVARDGNYWIRTEAACPGIFFNGTYGYERTGILRYTDQVGFVKQDPTTSPVFPIEPKWCVEENDRLEPMVKWKTGTPSQTTLDREHFHVYNNLNGTPAETQFGVAFLSIQRMLQSQADMTSFQTQYGNPMFLQLDSQVKDWPVGWMVVPEGYTSQDWAYIVLSGEQGATGPGPANLTGPHPIHLHGHDFAILQTSYDPYDPTDPDNLQLQTDNPPRRDVVYLPNNGFVIIGFKTDNPGNWLIHCHIADHAAGGLAMQILERQADASKMFPRTSPAVRNAQDLCSAWNSWSYDCRNFWPGLVDGAYPACVNATMLQNDSGI